VEVGEVEDRAAELSALLRLVDRLGHGWYEFFGVVGVAVEGRWKSRLGSSDEVDAVSGIGV
jgi:hypothetical protein